jgi:membrane protease subunit (stomatin/prohibitin family)
MSIFDSIKKQFINVIDWTESGDGVLSFRYPILDREIKNGAQLTVRESQLALFVNEGQIADLFTPGLHELTTQNLPILTTLKNWEKGFNSPFKSDVYFFSTREQIDQKWGTPQPIILRDSEMGPIRIRTFGTYSYRIKNPTDFFKKISGTRDLYTVNDLDGQLKSSVVTNLASFLSQSGTAFLDMASNQVKFSDTLKTALEPTFANYGLELTTFLVQSFSLPEELQAYFDKAAQMRMVGDLNQYTRFQAAESMHDAANNQSGAAGMGIGLGAGVAMAQAMTSAFSGANAQSNTSAQGGDDPMIKIQKLHELMKQGILSEAEFNDKKTELLKQIK